jgi:hypothetical protein
VAIFYIARSEIITPLPWTTFALPFSPVLQSLTLGAYGCAIIKTAARV